jgi:hypothetical protein
MIYNGSVENPCHRSGEMFYLELTSKQVQARRGYVVVWEGQSKVSRVTFEAREPKDTPDEAVLKAISLQRYGAKLFGGFDDCDVKIEFTNLGTLTRILRIDQ